jgi:2-methylcitrate dehydratase PrpD
MTLLQKIAQWVSTVTYNDYSAPAVARAKECLLDVCAVMLAGSIRPASRAVRKWAAGSRRSGRCRLIGTEETTDPAAAAMVNGLAAHILDFDDTSFPAAAIHPSAVLAPAVLAIGEELDMDGQELITAYLTGFEISARMGLSTSEAVAKGWFTSALFGTIGAAAATAKAMGLRAEPCTHALGLALCQAGGMRVFNGTPAKAYSVGRAAENGLTAAQMAATGIRAAVDGLENGEGFYRLYVDCKFDAEGFNHLGNPPALLSPGVDFKRYPTCSSTQAALEAVSDLKAAHLDRSRLAAV